MGGPQPTTAIGTKISVAKQGGCLLSQAHFFCHAVVKQIIVIIKQIWLPPLIVLVETSGKLINGDHMALKHAGCQAPEF